MRQSGVACIKLNNRTTIVKMGFKLSACYVILFTTFLLISFHSYAQDSIVVKGTPSGARLRRVPT
jgi:hypothetical protein